MCCYCCIFCTLSCGVLLRKIPGACDRFLRLLATLPLILNNDERVYVCLREGICALSDDENDDKITVNVNVYVNIEKCCMIKNIFAYLMW